MKKKTLVLYILLAAALILGFAVGVWRPYRRAQMVRDRLESTDWQHSDNAAVRHLVDEFGGTFTCENEWCEAEIHSSNRVLSILHLAPPMDCRALVHTTSNRITNFSLTLTNLGHGASSILVAKTYDPAELGMDGQDYIVNKGNKRNAPFVTVRISVKATREQQMTLNHLELRCLSRFNGCSEQQLGPEIWKLGS